MNKRSLTRRHFLRGALAAGGAAAVAPLDALARGVHVARAESSAGYGPIAPVADETTGLPLLELPAGFRYLSFGWVGDPMTDGTPTPRAHDGMGAFAAGEGRVLLVRNHERRRAEGAIAPGLPSYDEHASGGTTTLEFDTAKGQLISARGSLAGTIANCSGGMTPWGSWLSCEEDTRGPGDQPVIEGITKPHGYVFEVPADGIGSAEPLRAMGRFAHEAVAVDPETGIVYETEDRGDCGFYRFVPSERGVLVQGGRLHMLAVRDRPGYDTRAGQPAGVKLPVDWVDIEDPDPDDPMGNSVFSQGFARGGAVFRRLEGAFEQGGRIYFVSTSGGDAKTGQIWCYRPADEELELIFESPHRAVLDYPDNVTVSPRGGLVLCEDGDGTEFLHGLAPDGTLFRFCQNRVILQGEVNDLFGDYTGSEFAGTVFDPTGQWLFVNIQGPGISFAITGPWPRGSL
jgi:secreted PhoX family phosphatase